MGSWELDIGVMQAMTGKHSDYSLHMLMESNPGGPARKPLMEGCKNEGMSVWIIHDVSRTGLEEKLYAAIISIPITRAAALRQR